VKVQNLVGSGGDAQLILGTSNTLSKDTVGAALYANRTDESVSGDTDLLFKTSAGSTMNTNMIIKSNGNVGIGTTNPSQKLSIQDGQIIFQQSNTNQFESGRIRFTEYPGIIMMVKTISLI